MMPTELLTNREWLPGELLSGSEHQRPSWFFRQEISDLFLVYCTTSDNHISGGGKLTFENDITGLTLTLWIL